MKYLNLKIIISVFVFVEIAYSNNVIENSKSIVEAEKKVADKINILIKKNDLSNDEKDELYQLREVKGYLGVIEQPFNKSKCTDYKSSVKYQMGKIPQNENESELTSLSESAEIVLNLLNKWCK